MSVSENSFAINSMLESMHLSQEEFYQFCRDYVDSQTLSDDELAVREAAALADQEYKDDLLHTLYDIQNGTVSQNSLLEKNNKLVSEYLSLQSVSDNSLSENAIMTTKIQDYSVSESLLLFIAVGVCCCLFIFGFIKKGR